MPLSPDFKKLLEQIKLTFCISHKDFLDYTKTLLKKKNLSNIDFFFGFFINQCDKHLKDDYSNYLIENYEFLLINDYTKSTFGISDEMYKNILILCICKDNIYIDIDVILSKITRTRIYNNNIDDVSKIYTEITRIILTELNIFNGDKKYFEILIGIQDLITFYLYSIRYLVIIHRLVYEISNNILLYQEVSLEVAEYYAFESLTPAYTFIAEDCKKQFNLKLDASSSGLQQIGFLLEDDTNIELLEFSSITVPRTKNVGYDLILDIFIKDYADTNKCKQLRKYIESIKYTLDVDNSNNTEEYDDQEVIIPDNVGISTKNENMYVLVKSSIFSRDTIKALVMVIGYSGTVYGQTNRLYNDIIKKLRYNLVSISKNMFKVIRSICLQVVKIINEIIANNYTTLNEYLTLVHNIATKTTNKGIRLKSETLNVIFNPKITLVQTLKINTFDPINKIEVRAKRRKIGYFGHQTDIKALKSTLPPRIAHILDSTVLYYHKLIYDIMVPRNNLFSVHDSFTYTNDGSISTKDFKDLLRLSYYATYKKNFIEEILINNNIDPKQLLFEKKSIFKDVTDLYIDMLIKSPRLQYLITGQYRYTTTYSTLNYKYFNKVFITIKATDKELNDINTFISKELPGKTVLTEQLKLMYTIKYYLSLIDVITKRISAYVCNDDDVLKQKLRYIISNDNFFK